MVWLDLVKSVKLVIWLDESMFFFNKSPVTAQLKNHIFMVRSMFLKYQATTKHILSSEQKMYSGDNKYPPGPGAGHPIGFAPNFPPASPPNQGYPPPQNNGYQPPQDQGYPPPQGHYPGPPPPQNSGYGQQPVSVKTFIWSIFGIILTYF